MALYVTRGGKLVEGDGDPAALEAKGLTPATDADIDAHNSALDYEAKGLGGKAAEAIGTGVKSAIRTAAGGLDALGLDVGLQKDEHGNATPQPGIAESEALYGAEAKRESERHPFATGIGQAAVAAPAGFAAAATGLGALGGAGAALGAESLAGGYASEAENAWLEDRDFAQEAALTNVGAGLLVGGGVMGAGALAGAGLRRIGGMGRNLLTEAEHGASARAARDLLDEAPSNGPAKREAMAESLASRSPDDPGVAYLRDNADRLTDELATKQAKAAQELVDAYGEAAKLRQTPKQVEELIPDAITEQARWVQQVKRDTLEALDNVPGEAATAARARLSELGEGGDPARWFTEASEASDELLRAAAKAKRSAGPLDVSEPILTARRALDEGLKDEGLWGKAGQFESQRAAGYARRYGEHVDDFEAHFAPDGKTDPQAFARALRGEADPVAQRAIDATLESARATADVASKFGNRKLAARIRGAIDVLDRTGRQGQAVNAARQSVSRGTGSATDRALDFLSSSPAGQRSQARAGQGGSVAVGGVSRPMRRGAPVELTEQEVKALNNAKSSIGSLERPRGPLKEAQASALEKLSTDDPGQLWRGMRLSEEQLQGIIDGGYEITKHTPSSVDRAAAETFASYTGVDHKVPVLMQIDGAPRAVMAHGYPGDVFPDEQTAILFPGQRYKVVSVEDVTIPPEKDWMQPMQGKLLKLQGEAPGGSVAAGSTLGDIAKSPIGAVTGAGAVGAGARELYVAQKDESRQGAFAGAVALARSTKNALSRSVNSMLSRPLEDETDRVRIQPPEPPRVTALNYDATRDHIDQMARDPEYFAEVMAASFGNMPQSAPEVYGALSAEAAKTVQYLAAVAPGGSSGGPFAQRIPVGSDELWEFNERLRALSDPDFVPDELAAGRLSSTAIEAYELMRPKQYAHLQRTVFERLAELNEQGIPVTVAAREQLDVLLNIDGGGDPALTWKVAERAYAAQARKAASASAIDPAGGGDASSSMQSGALSTLKNGASAIAQTG